MPLPTSWFVPKIAATEVCTVPYSKLSTATRFFCCPMQVGTRAQTKTNNKQDVLNRTTLAGSRRSPTLVSLIGSVFTVVTGVPPRRPQIVTPADERVNSNPSGANLLYSAQKKDFVTDVRLWPYG